MAKALDLVGVDEIAELLGVDRRTVSVWQGRGWPAGSRGAKVKPPKLLGTISGRMRVYDRSDVERWARETGRFMTTPVRPR
jgi:phage terminase Nu1 subunit (DNA packaging protein)